MKTEEKNKLIADFMRIDVAFDGTFSINPMTKYGDWEKIKYDTDWNWLMEVVDKIYEMDLYYDRYIDYNSSMISDGKINLGTRINRVYEQVVEFIKWYNENSAKNN